jgi:hypothetical protein
MSDPVRLKSSADAPALVVSALERARADAPDAARLGKIAAGVVAELGLPSPDGGGGGGGGAEGGGGAGGAGGGAGAVGGIAGGASAATLAKIGAATLGVGAAIAAVVVASQSPSQPATTSSTKEATQATDAAPATAVASAAQSAPTSIAVEDLPSAPTASTTSTTSTKTGTAAASGTDPAATERAEVTLLAQAQSALTTQPAETLARCDEHARRFAGGTLAQEREVLAIDALLRLGRRSEAEARAARFRGSFPKSGHLRRIDALLGD